MIIALFVLAWTFRLLPYWRTAARSSAVLAGAALALFFVRQEGPWVGPMQRLMVTVIGTWLILTAARARSIVRA